MSVFSNFNQYWKEIGRFRELDIINTQATRGFKKEYFFAFRTENDAVMFPKKNVRLCLKFNSVFYDKIDIQPQEQFFSIQFSLQTQKTIIPKSTFTSVMSLINERGIFFSKQLNLNDFLCL